MEPISELIKLMKEYGPRAKKGPDTLLTELKHKPIKVMSFIVDHLNHSIQLIDIKSTSYFVQSLS